MDCIIPSHGVRPFCAAIACLSRIGKDLYVDFDVLEGLTLRALNDAKSAFGSFHFDPAFFERCTTSSTTSARTFSNKKKRRHATPDSDSTPGTQSQFVCRIPLRAMAAIVRPRRNVLQLRLYHQEEEDGVVALSFEFYMPQQWRVVHRVAVASDAGTVSAVAPKEDCSEVVCTPKVLLRMLDPVQKQRTPEVALIFNDKYKVVTATSFHHVEVAAQAHDNVLLQASSRSNALLKTETSIECDELEEFHFVSDREGEKEDIPEIVNEEVVLVFGAKELKVRRYRNFNSGVCTKI